MINTDFHPSKAAEMNKQPEAEAVVSSEEFTVPCKMQLPQMNLPLKGFASFLVS